MPDWFSFENNAGSIAVADLGSGTTDVVVYQIDNPPGISQGFYKIGKNLDANGEVQKDGWSFWTVLPGWFSFENAGGGVAFMNVAGKHKLLTMFIDDPIGQNAGLYRVLDLDSDPDTAGSWTDLRLSSEVLAVHAAVLHTGEVMFFAGSGNVKARVVVAGGNPTEGNQVVGQGPAQRGDAARRLQPARPSTSLRRKPAASIGRALFGVA